MIDEELLSTIRQRVNEVTSLDELGESDARGLVDRVGERYVVERASIWWWQCLSDPVSRISYGDEGPFDKIREIVEVDEICSLIVTDDEPQPWVVIRGPLFCLLELLDDQRFFEYILVGGRERWCIFDTHHNQLVLAGSLVKMTGREGVPQQRPRSAG